MVSPTNAYSCATVHCSKKEVLVTLGFIRELNQVYVFSFHMLCIHPFVGFAARKMRYEVDAPSAPCTLCCRFFWVSGKIQSKGNDDPQPLRPRVAVQSHVVNEIIPPGKEPEKKKKKT